MSIKLMNVAASSAVRRPSLPTTGSGRFRGDIEGMRAVAVLLVMLSHAGIPFLPGGFVGVDVFFVISGFLITGLLLREFDRKGRISLRDFYARRARRILPAACVVLVATLAMTFLFLPRARWEATGEDVLASALYVMNWDLAAGSTDYAAVNAAPSMTQQYWSLSVEEQFYLVWPVLLIALGLLAQRMPGAHRRWYLAGLAMIGVPSFVWSVLISGQSASAYYVTTTRAWELALGGAVAVVATALTAPRWIAAAAAWLGVATVVASAVLIESAADYPGWPALAPTVGVATAIAFGPAAGGMGPAAILTLRPMLLVGALSYSLYLWHWPVLVAAQAQFGNLSVAASLLALAIAWAFAAVSFRYIENPVRFSPYLSLSPSAGLRMGLLVTTTTALLALFFQLVSLPAAPPAGAAPVSRLGETVTAAVARPPGAGILAPEPRDNPAGAVTEAVPSIVPDPVSAARDTPENYNRMNCMASGADDATPVHCIFGDKDARVRVTLVGDSHADHWIPAVRTVAEENDWRLTILAKGGCPFIGAEIMVNGLPSQACADWNASVKTELLGLERPDILIVTHSTYPVAGDDPRNFETTMVREMRSMWTEMVDAGVPVVVIRDTPILDVDVPECVSENLDALAACATPRSTALSRGGGPAQEEAVQGLSAVRLIDINDWICPTESCAPVIGGVLVWRDRHHLTATYSNSLAVPLNLELKPAVTELMSTR